MTGRTHEDRIVVFEGNERLIGKFAAVKIVDCTPFTLFGEIATPGTGVAGVIATSDTG